MNIFSASFWGQPYWQGIGAMVGLIGVLASPLLTILYDRLFGKKEHQQHINAYKALLLPDRRPSAGEFFWWFILFQAAASYGLSIVARRLLLITPADPNTLLILSFVFLCVVAWGLSAIRRKSLAKLLIGQFLLAFLIFVLIFLGQKGNQAMTENFTWLKHAIGQYLPSDVKQFPVISSLRTIDLHAVPVDLRPQSPRSALTLFLVVYLGTLAFFLFCYTLYKRHHARQVDAFVFLSEKKRKDQMDLLDYQIKQKNLEIKEIERQEKGTAEQVEQRVALSLEREQLAVEQRRLEVTSTRLDVEKKRIQYILELSAQLIDTLYEGGGDPTVRAELLRNTLPIFKEFGHPEQESTALILDHLQRFGQQPRAIVAAMIDPATDPTTSKERNVDVHLQQ